MKRWILPGTALVVLLLCSFGVFAYYTMNATAGSRSQEHENEAIVMRGVTSCGVERWAVKTGMDGDAKRVNGKSVTATSISHLRSLPSPGNYIPLRNRIRPVETTVWQISGTLLRIKQEADSDYHLVVADSGGRTMIMEAPAPQCVGSSSPFLGTLTYVRRILQERFHPTISWVRPNVPVTIKGIGFFDFLHGQSGVAPNGIELHPVLSIRFVSGSGSPPPVPPTVITRGKVRVTAHVSNASPNRYTRVTVYGTVSAGGKPVAGASMQASWHFKTGTGTCTAASDGHGGASCSRYIGRATVGYQVVIDVTFTVGGGTYSARTSFTPR